MSAKVTTTKLKTIYHGYSRDFHKGRIARLITQYTISGNSPPSQLVAIAHATGFLWDFLILQDFLGDPVKNSCKIKKPYENPVKVSGD